MNIEASLGACVLSGVTLGLTAGISPGPLLMLIVNLSLSRGVKEGIKASFAPLLTDFPILILALLAVASFAHNPLFMAGLSLTGALALSYYAWQAARFSGQPGEVKSPGSSLAQAVTANFLNPNPYIFWSTVGAPLFIETWRLGPQYTAAFGLSFFGGLCGTMCVLALCAGRSASLLSGRAYLYAVRATGLGLAWFAYLFYRQALSGLF